jgi:hypothetical protein
MRSSAAVARASSTASYSLDVLCLEQVAVEPMIEMRAAPTVPQAPRGPHLATPRAHALGEMGQHLSRVSRKIEWPVGGDID